MLLEIKNVFKQVTEPSGEIITVSHAEHLILDKGGQMLLTGPSGSGKTTLLHMIAGLLSPSGGALTICRKKSVICGVRAISVMCFKN